MDLHKMNQKNALAEFKQIKKYADTVNIRLAAEGWKEDWHILISTILSAQTRDEVTIPVSEQLFEKYPTIEKLAHAKLADIEKTIARINFYRNKARNLWNTAKIVARDGLSYDEAVLLTYPGVGRKVANVFLSETNKKQAIAVDTHVFRIARRMGWSQGNTPEKVEKDLCTLFPKRMWNEINPTLVRFGKEFGRSKTREEALLSKIKTTKKQ